MMEAQEVEENEEKGMAVEITGEMSKTEIMNLVLEKTEKKMIVKDNEKSKFCIIL